MSNFFPMFLAVMLSQQPKMRGSLAAVAPIHLESSWKNTSATHFKLPKEDPAIHVYNYMPMQLYVTFWEAKVYHMLILVIYLNPKQN